MCAHQLRPYVHLVSSSDRTPEAADRQHAADRPPVPHYEIRVQGHLSPRWAAWFDDLAIAEVGDGTTCMSGPVPDQAALHGLLQKLRDLGITLLSVTPTEPSSPTEHPDLPHTPTVHTTPGATP